MTDTTKNVRLKDLSGNVLVPYTGITVPTKTSDLQNDSGFITSHQTIKQDGITGATVTRLATCSTEASTAAKTASITAGTFTLETGVEVTVKFANANTANSPTLSINGKAAKNIFHNGAQITNGANKALLAGTVKFVYDGTQWQLIGNYVNSESSDTKNTAGATDTSSKIYLVGATSQSANPQTYSHDTAFVDADGVLNSANPAASANDTKVATTKWVTDKGYLTSDDVTSTYSATGTAPVNGAAVKSAIDSALTSAYKPSGSVAYASLPTLSASVMGNVYNVTDEFTIDNRFVEYDSGKTKTFPAGSEVGVVDIGTGGTHTYKFSVMSGFIDLSGYQQTSTAVTHTASTAAGSATQPVYVNSSGVATACTYTLGKSVPADAVFTDHTYSEFTGATSSADGAAGLVKKPLKADKDKFLKGDGTWTAITDSDTTNTAGSGDTASKIYLVGATSQTSSAVTYSHDTVFVDVNGRINSAAPASDANDTTVATTKWVKDQSYLTSVPSHNQASSTINAMTGYSKASSVAAIAATDSLNTAIGKLEKALDGKQATISNLSTIESGAAAGATAVQPGDDISNLVNDAGYLTAVGWSDIQNVPDSFTPSAHTHTKSQITDFPSIPSTTSSVTSGSGAALTSGGAYTNLVRRLSSSAATGSATKGVYVDANGQVQAMTYSVGKSVPADAVFTDHTYSVFTGADGSSAGTAGLVKAPAATDNNKFLKGDGTWANVSDSDTKNTTGGDDTSSKIFLVGMTAQTTSNGNSRTYTHDTAFVDTNGRLNSAAPASGANDTTVATTKWVKDQGYLTSVSAHTHVGTDVTLTGYSKASSASAVAATDTVNAAIGKLEKALDGKQASGSYLTSSSSLNAANLTGTVPSNCYTNTTYSNFVKSGSGAAAGLVPAPSTTAGTTKYLCENGEWGTPAGTYSHPTTSGNKHIPSGGSSGQFLKWSSDGTATWSADNNTVNTAGGDDTSSKIFLVGMTAQTSNNGNSRTYTQDTAFVDTVGTVNSSSPATTIDLDTASNLTKVATLGTVKSMIDALITQLDTATALVPTT